MADITAASVKELRDRSGAGMMDCKKALTEANGDIEAATDWLRAKGLAAAQKKSSRTAAEGLVGVAVAGTKGVAVEVNSETDFVAKNEQFQDFVRTVSTIALETGAADAEALSAAAYPSGGTVAEKLVANIATIGENQTVRRVGHVEVSQGVVVPYVHNAAARVAATNVNINVTFHLAICTAGLTMTVSTAANRLCSVCSLYVPFCGASQALHIIFCGVKGAPHSTWESSYPVLAAVFQTICGSRFPEALTGRRLSYGGSCCHHAPIDRRWRAFRPPDPSLESAHEAVYFRRAQRHPHP